MPQVAASSDKAPASAAAKPAPPKAAAAAAAADGARVAGTVSISAALREKAAPDDSLIIFARAAEGPRMPLAMLRAKVKDLPKTFTLDDSMYVAPDFKLSSFAEIVVGARVSKSGSPMPQKGDFEGMSKPVKLGRSDVSITIDTELP
jgi:cytochrome c-type biogenesis protein CcmH